MIQIHRQRYTEHQGHFPFFCELKCEFVDKKSRPILKDGNVFFFYIPGPKCAIKRLYN